MIEGLKIATGNSGIKYKNRDDLLLISFENSANIAGVFTKSSMAAASIKFCQKNIKNGKAKALIVNAGNANAFTGKIGQEIVQQTAKKVANELNCLENEVFISSTGVIGEVFDYNLITDKVANLVQNSQLNDQSWRKAAAAIMTTDTRVKISKKTCKIDGKTVNLVGIAKGSGMIAPNMATMLSYIFTDADINSDILQILLKNAVDNSFNAITVDSDQSTNDTVLAFATKTAQNSTINSINDPKIAEFSKNLNELALELAKMIVIDGEGAQKLIEISVNGANSVENAKETAMAIANSPLVKTAIAGEDPNWGRIVMAVGKSCYEASSDKLEVKIGDYILAKNGERNPDYIESEVHNYLKNSNVKIAINLGLGLHSFTAWTCDLTEEYIKINKDYRS